MKKPLLKLFLFGLLLRIVLAAFLYHTDIKGQYHEASLFDNGVRQAYQIGINETTPLHYPPPIYFLYNSYPKVAGPFFSDYFTKWMDDWSYSQVSNHPNIFQDLLAMKLPLILFDLLAALIIVKIVTREKREIAAAVWLFNPFSIYAIYAFSQFDIIPTFLILLSVFFWKKKKINFSYVALGFAAGVKVFPLLLLPYYLVLDPRNVKKKIVGATLAIGGFLLCLAPIISSKVALKSIFLSGLTSGVFQAKIPLGNNMAIPIYLVLYLFFLILILFKAVAKPSVVSATFMVLATLLGLSSFNPQWMLWAMPFLLILICEGKVGWKESLGVMVSYVAVVLLINDSFVSVGLFRAINNTFATLPSLRSILDRAGIGEQLQAGSNALLTVFIFLINLEILKKVPVSFGPLTFRPRVMRILILWAAGLVGLFLLFHVPLTVFGRYLDTNYMVEQSRITLTSGTSVSQKIQVNNPNFFQIQVRVKNPNRVNDQVHIFNLLDEEGNLVKTFEINGLSLGDDFDLDLTFPSIKDSKDKQYTLTIKAPQGVKEGSEIILPYNKNDSEEGLSLDGKIIPGRLAYYTYYKAGGFWSNVSFSLTNIVRKL